MNLVQYHLQCHTKADSQQEMSEVNEVRREATEFK